MAEAQTTTVVAASTKAKYWEKTVVKDGCWGWTGAVGSHGYGAIRVAKQDGGSQAKAHRVSYELHIGPIPAGAFVDHVCHTRSCTNPEHLRLATNKQNQENRSGANRNNSSGVRGVTWDADRSKWAGVVFHNGKPYRAGRHDTIEAAEVAVIAKRLELFTHSNMDRAA